MHTGANHGEAALECVGAGPRGLAGDDPQRLGLRYLLGEFGQAIADLRDMDGNLVPDIAVGAPFDDDGGLDRGAMWVLFLDSAGLAGYRWIRQLALDFAGALNRFSDAFEILRHTGTPGELRKAEPQFVEASSDCS